MSDIEKLLEEQIRERAYDLWEQDERPASGSEGYWHCAGDEMESQDITDQPTTAAPSVTPPKAL